MKFLELTLPTIEENVALDEALLLDAEAGGPEVLRLWEWPTHAVVVGAGGRIADDVVLDACFADGVPIVRRSSGGGTVLLGHGCLLFSLVLAFDRDPALTDLHASYRFILNHILSCLNPHIADLARQGTSDLTRQGRKFSGNAQQRKQTHLLHHGTLLYAFDPALVSRYLKLPSRQPEYRHGRSHDEFITNLSLDCIRLSHLLRESWAANESLIAWPADSVARLMDEKYGRLDWTHRR